MMKTFGNRMTVSQAESYVRDRKWKIGNETLLKYVLEVEKLRRHLAAYRFTETEFVDILLKGMNLPHPYSNMLSFPRTIDELKNRMHRFEVELLAYANSVVTKATAVPNVQTAAKSPSAASTDVESNTRCFNCSKLGRFQSRCPYNKRPTNLCFKCWNVGHTHRNCPNPRKILTNEHAVRMPTVMVPNDAEDVCRLPLFKQDDRTGQLSTAPH